MGRSGWLSLPPALLREAGIGERAQVRIADGGLLVSATGAPGAHAEPAARRATAPCARTVAPGRPWNCARSFARSGAAGPGGPCCTGSPSAWTPGRMNAVAGASGSGKTTLLRLVAGLDRPDSGPILLDAHDLAADDAESLAALRRRRIGYLAQEPTPVGFLSAEENIVLALRSRGWGEGEARARAAGVLARVGLRNAPASAPGGCRPARRSGSPWPEHWPAPAGCSSSTSRPRAWTKPTPP